jgi:hypothetical protein
VAVEVCGGRGDGQTQLFDDCAGDGGLGDAESEVACVGGDAEGEFASGFDDDGEGTGPEFFGEAVEGGIDLAGQLVGLGYLGDEEREGLVAGTGFDFVYAVDCAEIDGVDGETVEGVGGESDDVAAVETAGDVLDERWLRFVGMDAERFCGQVLTPRGVGTPDLSAQSIQSLRLRSGLGSKSRCIWMQSLQDGPVDDHEDGTFFKPRIILWDVAVGV